MNIGPSTHAAGSSAALTAIELGVGHRGDVGVAAVLAAQQEGRQPQRAQPHKQRAQQAGRAVRLRAAGRGPHRAAAAAAGHGGRGSDVHGGGDDGRQLQRVAGGDEPLGAGAQQGHQRQRLHHLGALVQDDHVELGG